MQCETMLGFASKRNVPSLDHDRSGAEQIENLAGLSWSRLKPPSMPDVLNELSGCDSPSAARARFQIGGSLP